MGSTLAIYVKRKGQQMGPYAAEVIQQLLFENELSAEDLGWHVGLEDWEPLGSLEVLRHPIKRQAAEAAQGTVSFSTAAPPQRFSISRIVEQDPHLQAVGTCWYVVALCLGLPAAFLCLYSLPQHNHPLTIWAGGALFIAFLMGFVGYGVRESRAWAVRTARIGAVLLLFAVPIGTVLGIYLLEQLKKATPPKAKK